MVQECILMRQPRQYRLVEVPVNEELREELQGKSPGELKDILFSMKTLHNKTDTDTVERAIRAIEIEVLLHVIILAKVDLPRPNAYFIWVFFMTGKQNAKELQNVLHKRLEQGMVEEVRKSACIRNIRLNH